MVGISTDPLLYSKNIWPLNFDSAFGKGGETSYGNTTFILTIERRRATKLTTPFLPPHITEFGMDSLSEILLFRHTADEDRLLSSAETNSQNVVLRVFLVTPFST